MPICDGIGSGDLAGLLGILRAVDVVLDGNQSELRGAVETLVF